MAEQDGDKSQEATPHRRQLAREEGQVAQSQDLAAAVLLVTGLAGMLFLGGPAASHLGDAMQRYLGGKAWLSADPAFVMTEWISAVGLTARVLLPLLVVLLVVAVLSHLFQIGFLFLPEKLAPDISRLDVLAGLQRIFSLSNTVHLGFGLIKIALVATVAAVSLYNSYDEVLVLVGMGVPKIAWATTNIVLWTGLKIALALLILALLDYGWQRWKYERDLRMTPQEVREEMRNLQGDPQIIARRRAVQRQLVINRLQKAVPKADVVVTNPTELAIAIRYEHETMNAPVVIAKGAGVLAQRIRKLALEHGVPIVERKPLAQALYKQVDVNRPIPPDLFGPVAEVLAYVYQLQGRKIPTAAELARR